MPADPDAAFLELFERTAEFRPGDGEHESYRNFNLHALDRGRSVVTRLNAANPIDGKRALDIGCGSGGLAIALAEAGATVDAIEPDPIRLEWARARIGGHSADVRLADGVAENLPYPDATFAIVTLDSVIEHVEDPAAVIREVARVLQPGGITYVVSPNKASVLNLIRDPHYQMLGVVLMPRWLGKLYVERVRRVDRGYWVNVIPTRRWLIRQLDRAGIGAEPVIPDGFEKLATPDKILHPLGRRAATVAARLGLGAALPRLALAQYPTFILLGRRRILSE